MSGINLHIILGNVGKIETRYNSGGNPIVNMSIATSEKWKDKETGQAQEKTHWHNVVVFGKPAEIIAKYVSKGDKLYISGKSVTRKWQDQSGQDRYSTETVVDGFDGKFELLGGRKESNNANQPSQTAQNHHNQAKSDHNNGQQGNINAPTMPDTSQFEPDQDIPFN